MWKCEKCGAEFKRLQICWGTFGGEKVDVIDYFCPHCPNNQPVFQGTPQELEAYWKMEWDGQGEYREG
jgi:hypothetical protein